MTNVKVKKIHGLDYPQPSPLTGKGSTTIPQGSSLKRGEVRRAHMVGRDMVCSIRKRIAATGDPGLATWGEHSGYIDQEREVVSTGGRMALSLLNAVAQ